MLSPITQNVLKFSVLATVTTRRNTTPKIWSTVNESSNLPASKLSRKITGKE